MKIDNSSSKFTVGIFVIHIDNPYIEMLCNGIEDSAKEQNVNTIYILGGPLQVSFAPYEARANILYELVDSTNIDGLIISSGSICNFLTQDRIKKFFPIKSMALRIWYSG